MAAETNAGQLGAAQGIQRSLCSDLVTISFVSLAHILCWMGRKQSLDHPCLAPSEWLSLLLPMTGVVCSGIQQWRKLLSFIRRLLCSPHFRLWPLIAALLRPLLEAGAEPPTLELQAPRLHSLVTGQEVEEGGPSVLPMAVVDQRPNVAEVPTPGD